MVQWVNASTACGARALAPAAAILRPHGPKLFLAFGTVVEAFGHPTAQVQRGAVLPRGVL